MTIGIISSLTADIPQEDTWMMDGYENDINETRQLTTTDDVGYVSAY